MKLEKAIAFELAGMRGVLMVSSDGETQFLNPVSAKELVAEFERASDMLATAVRQLDEWSAERKAKEEAQTRGEA